MLSGPRIVLHAGAPKTGSTYLQQRIRADPRRWRAHGVYVPVLPEVAHVAGNGKLLAAVLGAAAPGLRRDHAHLDISNLDSRRLVARLLADWRPERETLVLSAENFDLRHAARLRELLPAEAAVTVVLFVRNQHRWIESYYRQSLRRLSYDTDLHGCVEDVLARRRYYPDWWLQREAWVTAFGGCTVRIYEDGDLFAAFTEAAGIAPPLGLGDPGRRNVALTSYEIAYLRALPRPIAHEAYARRRRAAAVASRPFAAPKLRFLTAEDAERIRVRFAPGNRRLMEALGRPYEGSPLDLSVGVDSPARLDAVYASRSYVAYRALANIIYAAGG